MSTAYAQLTRTTDPGELVDLYEGLPEDLPSLCRLIKAQLIHPDNTDRFKHSLKSAKREDARFDTVADMLEALEERNANGLLMDRAPNERLILSCRYHALLLLSILRSRNVPARCRVGFASYLSDRAAKHVDHWICEVWNDREERWVLVDPDREIVDIREGFILAGDAWLMARNNEINPRLFGAKTSWGLSYIRNNLCHDMSAILGREPRYWDFPPIGKQAIDGSNEEALQLLDELAIYLQDPDANIASVRRLHAENACLQYEE
ncbi:transglutaminase domain-containing protein [Cohnella faecalis]|uniref:Transglutaminase n=1 Tax=Cohnella faecalis TaxID=2315694 RepID=A0A398CGR0_9BACL|nr:transglutaminase domain-containing protein [Cohnella faecalis]RIE01142.1 transglutaminase [Cohnella faecalis]